MSKAMMILAENLNRLIGPTGIYPSNASASAASPDVSRSTFDRLRQGAKPGATAVGIDKLDGVATALDIDVWQLFVPGLDPRGNLPRLASNGAEPSLLQDEAELLRAYRALGPKEKAYLLEDSKKYLRHSLGATIKTP